MVCKMCCVDYLNIAALALEAPWLGFHGRHKRALRIMQDPRIRQVVIISFNIEFY